MIFPELFGDWNNVFRRFGRWSEKGAWWRIFEAMSDDPTSSISSSTAPLSASTSTLPEPRGSEDQAIGRSRGGLSTQIHMAVRGPGCPVRFTLTAGQKGDATRRDLIEGLPAKVIMADTACDSDALRHAIAHRAQLAVIPNDPSRRRSNPEFSAGTAAAGVAAAHFVSLFWLQSSAA